MKSVTVNGLSLWQFENLSNQPSVRHFVTGRNSAAPDHEFTLSFSSSPDKDQIRDNRARLAGAMGISPAKLYFPSQVHHTRIVNVTSQTRIDELMETDALISNTQGICIAVMSADCVPILLYDKHNQAVGAVHSGWRGTVALILEKTLQTMKQTFGTRGEDVIAGIGPSVCQESYEVGEEVVHAVYQSFGQQHGLLQLKSNRKAHLDLWKANEIQLLEFGVKKTNIETSDLCTVKNNDHFFSARRGDRGRFAAGIMVL